MRKPIRLNKSILSKSTASAMILCLILGNTYLPAWAREGDSIKATALQSSEPTQGDSVNQDLTNKKEQPPASKDGTQTEVTSQNGKKQETTDNNGNSVDTEEKEPSVNEKEPGEKEPETDDSKGEKEPGTENPEENEPGLEDQNTDGKAPGADQSVDEKEPETDDSVEEKEPGEDGAVDSEESEEGFGIDDGKLSDDEVEAEEPEEVKEDEEEWEVPEIIHVVVSSAYLLALNPYCLPIMIGEDEVTTEQVISGNYGIVNKSSTDQIVRVSLTIEDRNDGKLVFVDSAEEAWNAGEGVYAVYLAAVPANEEEVLVDGVLMDENITGEALQNVMMSEAWEQAVTLYAGENEIAFKLSKAAYYIEGAVETTENNSEDDVVQEPRIEQETELVFGGLAPDGSGVTAYTFYGVMNPNAPWENLSGGIRVSVVYTYQTADGSEEIIEGTGAMIYAS